MARCKNLSSGGDARRMIDLDRWQEIFFTLKQHKLRTILTAFGVFWGMFMLVIMLGAGNSLQNGAIDGFGGQTNTVFMWTSGKTQIPYKGLPTGRRIQLNDEDMVAIRRLPELGLSSTQNTLGGWQNNQYIVRKDKTGTFETVGIEPDAFIISGYTMSAGRSINQKDLDDRRKVAVIGIAVKDILFEPGEEVIGEELKIAGVNFTVVGVFETTSNNPGEGEKIMMANSTMRTTFNQSGWIGHIEITPAQGYSSATLEDKVRGVILERHKVHPDDTGALGSFNLQKEFDKVQGLFTGIQIFSWVVAIGTIFAGVVGVGNIMLIVVKERTREIGVHKALGATSWNVISTILQETIFLTFISGYFGLVAGVFLLEGVTSMLDSSDGINMFSKAEIDFGTAAIALITLVLAGALAAILPATKAARVDPIKALQDE
jgi:putative ABC transport system permease protein